MCYLYVQFCVVLRLLMSMLEFFAGCWVFPCFAHVGIETTWRFPKIGILQLIYWNNHGDLGFSHFWNPQKLHWTSKDSPAVGCSADGQGCCCSLCPCRRFLQPSIGSLLPGPRASSSDSVEILQLCKTYRIYQLICLVPRDMSSIIIVVVRVDTRINNKWQPTLTTMTSNCRHNSHTDKQVPRLMTCRLRSNTKDAGMSYRCGAEFAHELISISKCIPEGAAAAGLGLKAKCQAIAPPPCTYQEDQGPHWGDFFRCDPSSSTLRRALRAWTQQVLSSGFQDAHELHNAQKRQERRQGKFGAVSKTQDIRKTTLFI